MSKFSIFGSAPRLPERPNSIDQFSAYLMQENHNGCIVLQWKPQVDLRRNFRLYQQKHPLFARLCSQENQDINIANFWLSLAINNSETPEDWEPINRKQFALQHLAAYLETPCYWTSQEIFRKHSDRPWEEYFYIARFIVNQRPNLEKFLSNYRSSQGANLATYMKGILQNLIRDETQVGKFSPWRHLCKSSDKELKQALQHKNYQDFEIIKFVFARKYFKQVFLINKVQNPNRPKGQKWPLPDLEDFTEAAECYNAEKSLTFAPHEVSARPEIVRSENIQEWMETCIKALQQYAQNSINFVSLDAVNEIDIETEPKTVDESPESQSFSSDLMNQTDAVFQEEMANIKALVEKRIQQKKLQNIHKKIPILYYGLGLSQTHIAERLGINQANINRHLNSYYKLPLLHGLARISQSTEWVKPYISQWLIKDYTSPASSDLIQVALVESLERLIPEYREALQLRYGQHLTEQQISQHLCIMESEVHQRISKAQTCLEAELLKVFKQWLDKYVNFWLSKFYQADIYSVLDESLTHLPKDLKIVVIYRYYRCMTEEQIAQQLNLVINQVKENLGNAKQELLNAVVKWIGVNLEIFLDHETELQKIHRSLKGWLDQLYTSQGRME